MTILITPDSNEYMVDESEREINREFARAQREDRPAAFWNSFGDTLYIPWQDGEKCSIRDEDEGRPNFDRDD